MPCVGVLERLSSAYSSHSQGRHLAGHGINLIHTNKLILPDCVCIFIYSGLFVHKQSFAYTSLFTV